MPFRKFSPFLLKPVVGLLLAAVFLAAMALFFIYYDPYRDVGPNLVTGGGLDQPTLSAGGAWRVRGPGVTWDGHGGVEESGGMRLEPQAGRGVSLNYTVDRPKGARLLRVSARVRSENLVPGANRWNMGRVLLSMIDSDGHRFARTICEIEGSRSWEPCEGVVPLAYDIVAVQMNVQNLGASGTLWVDDLRLAPAAEKSTAFYWRAGFAALWGAVLVYCGWLARLLDRPLGAAIIAIVMVITFGVTAPEGAIELIVDRGADAVNGLVDPELSATSSHVDGPADYRPRWTHEVRQALGWPFGLVLTVKKLGHLTLFALLAWLAFSSIARRREPAAANAVVTTGAALLLFAAAAEVIQFLSASRSPSFLDWMIDTAGIVVGGGFAMLWNRYAANRFARRTDPDVGQQPS
ncbi:MAG: VanZ family protein [Burkholderiales bacterium]